jgi:hypothetical protein
MPLVIDSAEVVKALEIISCDDPQAVVEVRLLPKKKSDRIYAGYFESGSFEKVPGLLEPILRRRKHNAYVTMNKIHSGLVARYRCRFEEAPDRTTSDNEVLAYRWLLVDIDPARPSGINATKQEFQFAVSRAEMVREYCINMLGLPAPMECESGNGYHLLFPLDMPATKANVEIIKNALKRLAKEFDSTECKIDETDVVKQKRTHEITRIKQLVQIGKAYGSLSRNEAFDGCRTLQYKIWQIACIPHG